MADQHANLPDFEDTEKEPAPSPPKRQRRKSEKAPPKRRGPATKAAAPKRARKKRAPRRLPGRSAAAESHPNGTPPVVGPEAAGVIRAYMLLDEAQRAVVFAYIQALR
jgi:hypothetical protein